MQYQGVVAVITSRDVPTKRGPMTFWSVALKGQDGFHGFGPKKPSLKKGDHVQFESEENAKGYLQADLDTLVVKAAPADEVASNEGSQAVVKKSDKGYWDAKAERDIANDLKREIGASRNTAIEWIKFLISQDALPKLPTAPKREEYFNALLDGYVRDFMDGLPEEPVELPKPVKKAAKPAVEEVEEVEEEWS